MSLKLGQVPGAANSGTKFRRSDLTEQRGDWTCPGCKTTFRGYLLRCLTDGCNVKRPA